MSAATAASAASARTTREVTHTAERALRTPFRLLKEIISDVVGCRSLAYLMMRRDITVQYRQSVFGILWAFAPPVVTAIALSAAKNANVLNLGETNLPYAAYVMLSMALWQNFTQGLNAPLNGLRIGRGLLTKISFPRETVILAEMGKVVFNFLIQLVMIIILFAWYKISVGWGVLLFPVALILLVLLGTTIGLFLAPIGALYNDIANALGIIVNLWLVLTPVFYRPPGTGGIFRAVVALNPVSPLLVTARELATNSPLTHLGGFVLVSALVLIFLPIGLIFYRVTLPTVVERWSS